MNEVGVYPTGKLRTNYFSLTQVTDTNITCPEGKRWIILGGKADRDVSATLVVYLRDIADNILLELHSAAAGVTNQYWVPGATSTNNRGGMMIMDTFMDVQYVWGVAQNHVDVCLLVLEVALGNLVTG